MKTFAKAIMEVTYQPSPNNIAHGVIKFGEWSYTARLSNTVVGMVRRHEVNLRYPTYVFAIPFTRSSGTTADNPNEQEPLLWFNIIGVNKNQILNNENGLVRITAKVIYESVRHQFILVKVFNENNGYDIIKLNGILADSVVYDMGTAVGCFYYIVARVVDQELRIEESHLLESNYLAA